MPPDDRIRSSIFAAGLLALSGFMLWADVNLGEALVRQWGTTGYREVRGTVTRSNLVRTASGDSVSQAFEVRYTYEVDGRKFEGTQALHSPTLRHDGLAESLKERFPQGASVPVFHAPGHPGRAVLLRGPQGIDLFWLLGALTLNVAVVQAWYLLRRQWRRRGGLGVFVREGRLHVPLDSGLSALGPWLHVVTGLTLFVMLLGLHPRLPLSLFFMGWVWAGVGGVCLFAARRHQALRASGALELVLDESRERLWVPSGTGGSRPLEVPVGRIQSILLQEGSIRDGEGDPVPTWSPQLTFLNGQGAREVAVIAQWTDEARAQALLHWLTERLELERPGQTRPAA